MIREVLRCNSRAIPCLLNFPLETKLQTRLRRLFCSDQTVINQTNQPDDLSHIQSYDLIPTYKSLLPSAVNLLLSGGARYLHEHCDKRHKQLGSIYREFFGDHELIFLSNTKLIQNVIANEGQYPRHNVPDCWNYYNEISKVERGLFFQVGEPWVKLRRAFNKVMLADPKSITRFSSSILEVNSDLFNLWKQKYSTPDGDVVIRDVKKKLNNWSIECTGFMLFGSRMGCIPRREDCETESIDSKRTADELAANVANMFTETSNLQLISVKWAHMLNLSSWRRFEQSSSNMLRIAGEYATEQISKAKSGKHFNRSLTEDLLNLGTLSDDEVSRSIIDLIIAAADTTSNSLQWMLYSLARYPQVQSKILEEVKSLSEVELRDDLIDKAPYLKAFIREVNRLYPTAPFLARTLDKDIVLANYLIPAGKTFVFSLFTTSRSDKYFENPLEFKPERWLRSSKSQSEIIGRVHDGLQTKSPFNQSAYASLPFGVGSRMCVGRRAADLQISLFIASLVNIFECSLVEGEGEIGIKLNMILCPDKPVKLKLVQRCK